jgi:hypothetical protein
MANEEHLARLRKSVKAWNEGKLLGHAGRLTAASLGVMGRATWRQCMRG